MDKVSHTWYWGVTSNLSFVNKKGYFRRSVFEPVPWMFPNPNVSKVFFFKKQGKGEKKIVQNKTDQMWNEPGSLENILPHPCQPPYEDFALIWECYLLVSHTATAEAYEWS